MIFMDANGLKTTDRQALTYCKRADNFPVDESGFNSYSVSNSDSEFIS
jgi:hypothetical protein